MTGKAYGWEDTNTVGGKNLELETRSEDQC